MASKTKRLKSSSKRRKMVETLGEGLPLRRNHSSRKDRDYEQDVKEILREFVSSPAFRYAAGGIAVAILARLANNMDRRYPEISQFIRENLDTMEDKLDSFRSSLTEEGIRH